LSEKDRQLSPSSRLAADVDRTLREINRSFDPLKSDFPFDFHVGKVQDGHVCVSVVMPQGMTRAFMALLRSLYGFFQQIDIKADHANLRNRPVDPGEVEAQRQFLENYQKTVCALFDELVEKGLPRNEAVKRTNAALKDRQHPWATHDLISTTLRAEGRFRMKKRNGNRRQK
jgi:hypothetical protein